MTDLVLCYFMFDYEDIGRRQVGFVLISKLGVSQTHGLGKILCVNSLGNLFRLRHGFHEWLPDNLVFGDSDEACLRVWGSFKHSIDGFNTLKRGQGTVVGYGGATSLNVPQSGDAGVEGEPAL